MNQKELGAKYRCLIAYNPLKNKSTVLEDRQLKSVIVVGEPIKMHNSVSNSLSRRRSKNQEELHRRLRKTYGDSTDLSGVVVGLLPVVRRPGTRQT